MKKYWAFFVFQVKQTFVSRKRVFIWYLGSITVPLLAILFWRGIFLKNTAMSGQFSFSNLQNYFLLLMVVNNWIIVHPETYISSKYIREGKLIELLCKPINVSLKFYIDEITYRLFQLFIGIVAMTIISLIFNFRLILPRDAFAWVFFIMISLVAQATIFCFKVILAYTSFWLYDNDSAHDLFDVFFYLLSGNIMPILLFPEFLQKIAFYTPFPYILYFPVGYFAGYISTSEALQMFPILLFWMFLGLISLNFIWKAGVKTFSASNL